MDSLYALIKEPEYSAPRLEGGIYDLLDFLLGNRIHYSMTDFKIHIGRKELTDKLKEIHPSNVLEKDRTYTDKAVFDTLTEINKEVPNNRTVLEIRYK